MRYSMVQMLVAGLLGVLVSSASARADDWPNWRGPGANGVVAPADYPVEWSNGTNILWSVEMPSYAGSTPVVWGDDILLTVADRGKNLLCCYDWQGNQKWQAQVGDERPGKHKKASGCNSSPVTDGKHVYAYFKSGDLACLDLEGNIAWRTNLQERYAEDTLWWDLGTSPVLTDDHVVVAVIQSGPSYLVAFDKESGEVAWKVDRMMDAPEEANQSYSTPLVLDHDGKQVLVVLGADHVTAHDAANGKEIWRVGGFNPDNDGHFRSIASPVYVDGLVVAPYARGRTLTAISMTGDIVWRDDQISTDVPSPAAIDGKVYVCTDKGRLACLNAQTGKEMWSVDTGRNRSAFSSSPILAGNRLYLAREDGSVFVFDTEGGHELLATNETGEFTTATPVFVNGKILLRTAEHLYCIGSSDR